MEEIEEKKKKSNTSAKSKSTNSVKSVVKKTKVKKIEVEENEPIKIQTTQAKTADSTKKKVNLKKNTKTTSASKTIKDEVKKQSINTEKEQSKKKTNEQSKSNEKQKDKKKTKKIKNDNETENLENQISENELEIIEKSEEIEEENDKSQLIIQEIDIEEIQNELEQHNQISPEDNNKIKHGVLPNIIIALILTVFYIFIELGFKNIETINYIVDLKVFSGICLIISIYLFEKAYKNEKLSSTVYAIEMLVLSIFNFALIYIYYAMNSKYEMIVFGFTVFEAVYYLTKTIVMYIKKKKEYFFEKSDIKEITSKKRKKEGI